MICSEIRFHMEIAAKYFLFQGTRCFTPSTDCSLPSCKTPICRTVLFSMKISHIYPFHVAKQNIAPFRYASYLYPDKFGDPGDKSVHVLNEQKILTQSKIFGQRV